MMTDPYAIYAAARAYWQNARYPVSVSYTVDVRVSEAGSWKSNHYHLRYDSSADTVHVDPVSDEELANPHHVPPGPGFSVLGLRVGKPEPRTDYLGIPELTPNYSFGIAPYVPENAVDSRRLVQQIRQEFHDPQPARAPSDGGLRSIADIHVFARDYAIALAGMEPVDGHLDYHLKLSPVRAPKRYRLRDLWIDERTYFTDKLVSDGNFVSGPSPGVTWTVTFADIGGSPYIAQETAQGSLAYPQAVYQQAVVLFEDVQPAKPSLRWTGSFTTTGDLLQEP